ncbi:LytTR family transcriptional regulator [Paenibacillus sp. 598K]|uniref:LytTR family DNA-binding domain-containing protein n=1 Tax=Paenibacillus sp. 598K TaxID=1117987 RepID=UPI000FFAD683|nr:LytTR family DNA-binding domain-containing protein [Paenibacillus sp. 598K]GBF74856.1 LytTR family transcriptional regulator [Paenibacillus sp. 598K]
MKIKIDISDEYDEPTIIIQAKVWSEELAALMKRLQAQEPQRLVGVEDERSVLLDPSELDYVYAEQRKVYAVRNGRQIELKMKLYEVEALLQEYRFQRFSKSVIGNLDQIDRFELVFNGNLCVHFKSGSKEYVSRGYVAELKQRLILGGGGRDDA